jgi:hypothetical protein
MKEYVNEMLIESASEKDVIGTMMTLASITLSHPRQVHVLLRPRRKDIMSISLREYSF